MIRIKAIPVFALVASLAFVGVSSRSARSAARNARRGAAGESARGHVVMERAHAARISDSTTRLAVCGFIAGASSAPVSAAERSRAASERRGRLTPARGSVVLCARSARRFHQAHEGSRHDPPRRHL